MPLKNEFDYYFRSFHYMSFGFGFPRVLIGDGNRALKNISFAQSTVHIFPHKCAEK